MESTSVSLEDLFGAPHEPASDRSEGFDKPQEVTPVQTRRELIDPRFVASFTDLLNGGVIEKVCNDDQLKNAISMRDLLRKHRLDAVADKKKLCADPDYVRFEKANQWYIDVEKRSKEIEKNLESKAAEYQMEKQKEVDRKNAEIKRKEDEEKARAEAERRRLAEEEHNRIMAEEAKRREAEAAAKAAEEEADAAKRAALIEQANAANAAADAELKAAADAARAANAVPVNATPIPRIPDAAPIRGLKPRMVYTAQVHDYFAAAIALLQGEDRGLLMTAAFQKAIQQAANKKAAYMGEKFELPGCSRIDTPASR